MQVGTLAIQHIFEKDVLHRVPLYQRPYVWTEAGQWKPLWDDLRRLAELLLAGKTPRAHFLGATVQDRETVAPGCIGTRLLVDGQQRLTTLVLFVKAFHDVSVELGHARYASAIAKLYRNNHPLSTRPHEQYKILPTNADREDFRAAMETSGAAALARQYRARADALAVGRTIIDAYLFFARTIRDWIKLEGEPEGRIAALYGSVRDNVRLVVIDLDEKDDAQLIFETLNARGTELLAADLVKNALLSRVEQEKGDAEHQYQAYWQGFDQDSGFWRAQTGRGHAQRARIEVFLQHALTIMSGQDVTAGQLYANYRDFAGLPTAPSAVDQLKPFHRYGKVYRRLIDQKESPRIRLFLERLSVMEFETVYPFLIALFDKLADDEAAIVQVLIDLESFLVRRLVSRLSTRGYNRLFNDLIPALHASDKDVPDAIRALLAQGSAEVDRWPTDAEFERAWTENRLYENLARPRLRLLLEAVEGGLRNDYAETDAVPRNLQVEHIMPQSWQEHWPLPPEPGAAEKRDHLIHTIGNLTLLSHKLNPVQSNRPWLTASEDLPGKRDGMRDNCTLFLNKAVADHVMWNEDAIRGRGAALFTIARQIWPSPID